MLEMRLGSAADYAVVMDRVVTSFRERNPGHLRFEDLYPDVIGPQSMPQWRLGLVDGEIAAGIQLVPRCMVAAGAVRVPGMGLGNVFCYPTHRSQGLMSRLLELCIADMERDGTAVCLLGGDRTRYGNYGWEHAGCDRALALSAAVTRFEKASPVSAAELRTWTGDQGDVLRMHEAYSALPYRTERTAIEFAAVLRRPGHVAYISEEAETGFGYVSVRSGTILEYAGAVEAVSRLLRYLLQSGSWNVVLPPVEHEGPLEKLMLHHAQSFAVRPTAMVRVISALAVLQAFLPLLRERLQAWDGDLVLRTTDSGETVRVLGAAGTVTVEPGPPDSPALELSRRDLALLLFGPFAPDLGDWFRHGGIRRLFPLPLHWHALSHV